MGMALIQTLNVTIMWISKNLSIFIWYTWLYIILNQETKEKVESIVFSSKNIWFRFLAVLKKNEAEKDTSKIASRNFVIYKNLRLDNYIFKVNNEILILMCDDKCSISIEKLPLLATTPRKLVNFSRKSHHGGKNWAIRGIVV